MKNMLQMIVCTPNKSFLRLTKTKCDLWNRRNLAALPMELVWVRVEHHLTLNSPAVMFCRAPAAPSRVHVFVSQTCKMRLYRPTI